MAYQIDKFNGTFLVAIDDQTINSTATDLRLVGRNYAGYGEIQNENFLHLLENFSNTTAPPRAISGQIWFDSASRKLKFYDGSKFKVASGAEASATAPAGLAAGDLWFNTVEQQVFTWTGTDFVLVGPEKAPIYGETSAAPAVIKDSVGSDQSIIKLQVAGETLAVIAKSNFIINPNINPITGFSELQPGINFINSSSTTGVTTSTHRFWGTAANAERLNGYEAADFLRSSNTVFTSQTSFRDSGFVVGDQNDLRVRVNNGNEVVIENTLNGQLYFRISNNNSNIKDVMVVKETGVEPGTTGIYNLGSNTAKWKEVSAETVKATTFYGNLVGTVSGPTGDSSPLALAAVSISGNFSMSAPPGRDASNFNINLANSTGVVDLASGGVGTLNNFNIGTTTRGTAAFTALTANGSVTFTANTASTTPTNGTLVVTGGVGVSGDLNVAGNGKFSGTGAIAIPAGTSEQQPVTPVVGMIRYNTTIDDWEGWDGTEWRGIGSTADEDYGLITGLSDIFVDYGSLA